MKEIKVPPLPNEIVQNVIKNRRVASRVNPIEDELIKLGMFDTAQALKPLEIDTFEKRGRGANEK